ncbi:MAG: diguanylate cyclase [Oxalobacter sp.]|nr:MAG: diguanylate cyclase [Oxalobacter sp.]
MDVNLPESRLKTFIKMYWRSPLLLHERFEKIIAVILSFAIGVIIVISLIQVIRTIVSMLLKDALNPLDHEVFQAVFGMIMTLLIAMEFLHSVVRMALRGDSLMQVKTVLLIGLLALTRKFIVLNPVDITAEKIAALGAAALALGVVYWLLRERDDKLAIALAQANKQQGDANKNSG